MSSASSPRSQARAKKPGSATRPASVAAVAEPASPKPHKARIKAKPRKGLKRFISLRRAIQLLIGVSLWLGVEYLGWSLLWIVVVGSLAGIILGKFFCRWMCPLGFMMELVMNVGDDDAQLSNMYMYFKVGCPIAWISGLLNKVSLFKVKIDQDQCIACGKCDKACYISQHTKGHSLFKPGATNASAHYACSRCLKCVTACPTGALNLGVAPKAVLQALPTVVEASTDT